MLVCLFIVVWLLRAFKLLRFPSFSCKNADFYTKNGRVNFGGFSGLPEQNYEVFFCLLWQFGLFLTTFTHQLHSGCLILANEIAANIKSTIVDLNLNPLVWSVVMQIKLQPLVWN